MHCHTQGSTARPASAYLPPFPPHLVPGTWQCPTACPAHLPTALLQPLTDKMTLLDVGTRMRVYVERLARVLAAFRAAVLLLNWRIKQLVSVNAAVIAVVASG